MKKQRLSAMMVGCATIKAVAQKRELIFLETMG